MPTEASAIDLFVQNKSGWQTLDAATCDAPNFILEPIRKFRWNFWGVFVAWTGTKDNKQAIALSRARCFH